MAAANAHKRSMHHRLGQIGRDTGIIFVGNILDKLFGFAFTIGIAKLYGLKVFGIFLLGASICQFGGLVLNLGFGNGLIRYVALYRKEPAKLKGIIWTAGLLSVTLGSLVGFALFMASEPLVRSFFDSKGRLVILLQWFALTLPFSAISGIWVRTLVGLKNFRAQAFVRSLIEPGTKIAVALACWAVGMKLEGLIIAYMASVGVASIAAYAFYAGALRQRLKGVRPILQFREFIDYCWPLVLRNMVSKATRRADVWLLGAFQGPVEITLYTFAQRMATFNTLITDAFNRAYTPHIPPLYAAGDHDQLQQGFQMVTKWTMLLAIPIFVMFIVFPGTVIPVLGDQFMPAATAMSVITAAVCFSYAVGPSETAIIMAGRSKTSLIIRIVGGALTLGLNIWLIPRHGLIGAAWGFTGAVIVSNVLAASIAYFDMGLHPLRWGYLKLIGAGVVAAVAGLMVDPLLPSNKYLAFLCLGSLLLVVYAAGVFLLGLDEEDKEMGKRLWRRFELAWNRQRAARLET